MNNQYDKYVGQIFDGRYKIIKRIGEGGMATVYEGFDTRANRIVAIKVLKDEIANDSQSVKRFINESKAVAMMSHPNIVRIYDVSVKDDLKYIVMEHIDGITLKSYMTKKGALSLAETVSYSEQILRALDHAHNKGVTHRDIKPQNILLLKDGHIKVTDFGIAKLPNTETVTMTDKAIGTVFYISPEQASGKTIDQRSDIYSLGAMMYEMMTGTLPFTADSPVSVAMMQVNATPKVPREIKPEIPRGLEQIVLLAMEKQPEDRFQSARQMLSYLVQIKNNPSCVFKLSNPPVQEQKKDSKISGKTVTEEKKEKKKKARYTMFPVILGVTLAFVLVFGLSAMHLLSKFAQITEEEETTVVTVPDLQGQTLTEDLRKELVESGFKITVEYDPADLTPEANKVITQTPAPGTERNIVLGKQYTDLKLTLTRGENSIVLSDYTVTEYRSVELKLDELGVKYIEEYEYNDNIPLGYVIRTSPMAGETVSQGGTVTLYISKGQKITYTEVPQLVGLTEEQAKQKLENSGVILGEITYEYSAEKAKGVVIEQSRVAYESVITNSVVIDIIVSKGPEGAATDTSAESTAAPESSN